MAESITMWLDDGYLYMQSETHGLYKFLAPKSAIGIECVYYFDFTAYTMSVRFDIAYCENNVYKIGYCDAVLRIGDVLRTMGVDPAILINVEYHYSICTQMVYLLQIDLKEYDDDFMIAVTYLSKPQYKAVFDIRNLGYPIVTNIMDDMLLRHISKILWEHREEILEMWRNKQARKIIKGMPPEVLQEFEKQYEEEQRKADEFKNNNNKGMSENE